MKLLPTNLQVKKGNFILYSIKSSTLVSSIFIIDPLKKGSINPDFVSLLILQSGSLYNEGMRPLLYSEIDAATKKIGWVRTGENIKYYKNGVRYNTEDLFPKLLQADQFSYEKNYGTNQAVRIESGKVRVLTMKSRYVNQSLFFYMTKANEVSVSDTCIKMYGTGLLLT